MKFFQRAVLIFLIFFSFFSFHFPVIAIGGDEVSTATEAIVTNILDEKTIEVMGSKQLYQKIELTLIKNNNQKIIIENGNQPLVNNIKYSQNDRVFLNSTRDPDGNQQYEIVDFIRKDSLLLLSIILVVLLIFIAKWRGIFSLIGMVFTFIVIFMFILPQILSGYNPVIIATIGSLIIIPISYYLAHGINKKTTVAIIGSVLTLIFTATLGSIFIRLGHLTGLSSEEAGMLSLGQSSLNMKGILLAGIVIGALGILDDITISQSAIVDELANTAKLTKTKDLYNRAMIIGKDHISSMVNTLVLAYAGASLPLLLIFVNNPHPFGEIINYEMVAEEIIRTLVGSIGLILAVPITTYLAAYWYQKTNTAKSFKPSQI